jgi:16S rRNA processing protein RimM
VTPPGPKPAAWDEMATVGRVARPHGLRGEMFVNPETDFPEDRFKRGATLFVQRGGNVEPISVRSVRFQRERPVIAVDGIEDVDGAAAMSGAEIRVPVESLAPLADGMFYRHDLVGCEVEDRRGNRIGAVSNVDGPIGTPRLVVQTPRGEVLVPLARDICTTIDVGAKRIVINPPDGLLELND